MNENDIEVHAVANFRRTPGGQHVGNPNPGVLVVHKPTGLAIVVDDERSQIKCKAEALRRLRIMHAAWLDLDVAWGDKP